MRTPPLFAVSGKVTSLFLSLGILRVTGSPFGKEGRMTENRPFLHFKAIKARASISSILDRYGVKLNQVNQTTLKGNCPLPSHSSKSKNTFYASEAKSAWYCHSDSCKKNGRRAGGNVIDFVAAMENLSVYGATARIDEM